MDGLLHQLFATGDSHLDGMCRCGSYALTGSEDVAFNDDVLSCFDFFFFSSRRRHTRLQGDWSSDVCSSDLTRQAENRPSSRRKKQVSVKTGFPKSLVGSAAKRPIARVVGPFELFCS